MVARRIKEVWKFQPYTSRGSWESLIYSQSVRSIGQNLDLLLEFEIEGSLVGLSF